LRVIGTGFGRTGTLSLREALVRLGFGPCDHMLENIERPERFALWHEAFRRKQAGQPIDWRPLLSGYRAIVDWPGTYFWRELVAAHPETKVILTVRDPQRWYESALATIFTIRARSDESVWSRLALKLLGLAIPQLRGASQITDEVIWQGTFAGRFADRDFALQVFEEHDQAVQAAIPPDRLLVFEVKQGWEPLCAFLGVPVPADEPFPHVNDADSFRQRIQERFALVALRAAGIAAVIAAAVATLVKASRRRQQTRDTA
jgi:hypothetical protein